MWIIILITVISLVSAILVLRQAIRDADESPEITRMYDKKYSEYDDAFISKKIDDNFKSLSLRKKLRKIEDDNIDKSFMG